MSLCHQRALRLTRVERFAAVTYIGDGLWDAQAAMALGWRFIGIGFGERAAQLRAAGACQVFSEFTSGVALEQTLAVRH